MPAGKSLEQCLERGRQHHLTEPTSPREKGLASCAFHILKLGLHEVGGSESSPLLWTVFPSSLQGGDGGQLRLEYPCPYPAGHGGEGSVSQFSQSSRSLFMNEIKEVTAS